MHILEEHPDKIHWSNLSLNVNAIHILEKNLDKIDWYYLSNNKRDIVLGAKYNFSYLANLKLEYVNSNEDINGATNMGR